MIDHLALLLSPSRCSPTCFLDANHSDAVQVWATGSCTRHDPPAEADGSSARRSSREAVGLDRTWLGRGRPRPTITAEQYPRYQTGLALGGANRGRRQAYAAGMGTQQAQSAKRRWSRVEPADRVAATSAAVRASTERRRLAHDVLRAIEAAGLTVVVASSEPESEPL